MGLFSRKKSHQTPGTGNDKPSIRTSASESTFSSAVSQSSGNTTPGSPAAPFPAGNFRLDPQLDPSGFLRSLPAVRERSRVLTERAVRNELKNFDVDMRKFPDIVAFVSGILKRDYDAPYTNIPNHGCYTHFSVGGRDRIANLLATFPPTVDNAEKCRRVIDLFFVTVLLDVGTGREWAYKSAETGRSYRASEGIAIATLEMFKAGVFSSNSYNKCQVDKAALAKLTTDQILEHLQSRPGNLMHAGKGRAESIIRLAKALGQSQYFGNDGRPGNMIDFLLSHPSTQASSSLIVPINVLWEVLMDGLAPIWPSDRPSMDGVTLGDAFPCASMPQVSATSPASSGPSFSPFPNTSPAPSPWESIVPLHALTQWMCYSLMQPMSSLMRMQFSGTDLLTGIAESRNGGLFIDMGVLNLKPEVEARGLKAYNDYCGDHKQKSMEVTPLFKQTDDVVVEWRGVTVGLLDLLLADVNVYMRRDLRNHEITMSQLLEGCSWKGGREVAEVSRPNTREPPIFTDHDGTLF